VSFIRKISGQIVLLMLTRQKY